MRKLLANTIIHCSGEINCTVISAAPVYNPYSNITTVSSCLKKQIHETEQITPDDIENVMKELSEIQQMNNGSALIDLSDITAAYIASTIELKIENSSQYKCVLCKGVFQQNEPVDKAYTAANHTRRACQSTMDICKTADYFLKLDILKGQFSFSLIQESIISSLNIEGLYPSTNFFEHEHPKIDLIKSILTEYIRYKGNHIATVSALEIEDNIRRKLSRLIVNKNQ